MNTVLDGFDVNTPDGLKAYMLATKYGSADDWNRRVDNVKRVCGGYPDFWFATVIMTGTPSKVGL